MSNNYLGGYIYLSERGNKYKKIVCALLLTSILLVVMTGCNKQDQIADSHMNLMDGKILEIRDGNILLLETTKASLDYKQGEKVLVHYGTTYKVDPHNLEAGATLYSPIINDIISVQYWPEEVTQKDGYDLIEGSEVTKYIND